MNQDEFVMRESHGAALKLVASDQNHRGDEGYRAMYALGRATQWLPYRSTAFLQGQDDAEVPGRDRDGGR